MVVPPTAMVRMSVNPTLPQLLLEAFNVLVTVARFDTRAIRGIAGRSRQSERQ